MSCNDFSQYHDGSKATSLCCLYVTMGFFIVTVARGCRLRCLPFPNMVHMAAIASENERDLKGLSSDGIRERRTKIVKIDLSANDYSGKMFIFKYQVGERK